MAPTISTLRWWCHHHQRGPFTTNRTTIAKVSFLLCVLLLLAHFFARTFPRVIKEQQQKYIFQTGTNRLDYYRDGLNTNHQKEEVGMITYARREESEDEARLEEKSSH